MQGFKVNIIQFAPVDTHITALTKWVFSSKPEHNNIVYYGTLICIDCCLINMLLHLL